MPWRLALPAPRGKSACANPDGEGGRIVLQTIRDRGVQSTKGVEGGLHGVIERGACGNVRVRAGVAIAHCGFELADVPIQIVEKVLRHAVVDKLFGKLRRIAGERVGGIEQGEIA